MRRWLPELAKVPEKALHQPWAWADKQGIKLDYPRPIVDHKQARQETLAAWEAARKELLHRQTAGPDLQRVIQPDDQHHADTGQRAPGDLAEDLDVGVNGVVHCPGGVEGRLRGLVGDDAGQIVGDGPGEQHIDTGQHPGDPGISMRVICDMATGSINSSAKPITASPSTISGMDDWP